MKTKKSGKVGLLLLSAFIVSIVLLLSSTSNFVFIANTGAGLWDGVEYKILSGVRSPSIIALPGGEMLALSNDGKLFRILRTGAHQNLGQEPGVSVVTPASYFQLNNTGYVVYTSDNASNSKLVVHNADIGSTASATFVENSSWSGIAVYTEGSTAAIFTSSIGERTGKVYRYEFNGTSLSLTASKPIGGSSKIPLLLSPDKKELYVLTQNGKFYVLDSADLSIKNSEGKPLELSGEFVTPMAMDSQRNIYMINTTGVMYVVDPSAVRANRNYAPKSAKVLPSANVAGLLIDTYGIIYAFGSGSVVAVQQVGGNLSALGGPFVVGGIINSTPLAVLGKDLKTYLIIPSTVGADGVITILSFDPERKTFTKIWDKTLKGGAFTITSAISSSQVSDETKEYYFVTSISNGYVYAWRINGKPLGDWPMYGQNRQRTNYLSFIAEEKTKIIVMAKDPLNGKFFSYPALKFSASIFDMASATSSATTTYYTNPQKESHLVPEAFPSQNKLQLYFEGNGSQQLFTPDSTLVRELGSSFTIPSTDTYLSFAQWDVDSIYKYPGKKDEGQSATNLANITFAYYDKRYDVLTNVKYLWIIKHLIPGSLTEQSTIVTLSYGDVEKGKNFTETIKPWPDYKPYDWTVYMWDPDAPDGYVKFDKNYLKSRGMINDSLELKLRKNGPAYIEIKYTTSPGSIRVIAPKYAYGRTYLYILVDAAEFTNTAWFNLTADNAKGIKFEGIVNEEIANVGAMQVIEKTVETNKIKYVFGGPLTPLSTDTRIATITALAFFEKPIYFSKDVNKSDYLKFADAFIQLSGVTGDPEDLAPYREVLLESLVFLLGDFDNNGWVNLDDWNRLVEKYGTTVTGVDVIYNIGPRNADFKLIRSGTDVLYDPGNLLDTENKINEWDIAVFAQMYGMKSTSDDILKNYGFKK